MGWACLQSEDDRTTLPHPGSYLTFRHLPVELGSIITNRLSVIDNTFPVSKNFPRQRNSRVEPEKQRAVSFRVKFELFRTTLTNVYIVWSGVVQRHGSLSPAHQLPNAPNDFGDKKRIPRS